MELRHLRYFVAVAEELHFRRAAERLHISQPPLSQQIKALETEVGVQLLRRDRRGVELTAAGQAFLEEARRVLAGADGAVARARRVDAGEAGALAVGFVGSTMYGRVPEVLRAFRERFPAVEVQLREIPSAEQVGALQEQRIDVGFLRPPVAGEGLIIETLLEEPIVVAIPHDHPLAEHERIAPALLQREDIVALARTEAPGLYAAMELELSRGGVTPRIVQTVTELQTAVGLVAAGLGVTFVPESVRALERPEVVYRPLDGAVPTIGLALAYREHGRTPATETFLDVARS